MRESVGLEIEADLFGSEDEAGLFGSEDEGIVFGSHDQGASVPGVTLTTRAGCDSYAGDDGASNHEPPGPATSTSEDGVWLFWDLDDACIDSAVKAKRVKDLISSARLLSEADPLTTAVAEDQAWMSEWYDLPDDEDDPARFDAPWVLRIAFDSDRLDMARITLRELCETLIAKTKGNVHIISTDDDAKPPVMRIRLPSRPLGPVNVRKALLRLLYQFAKLPLCVWREESPAVKRRKTCIPSQSGLELRLPECVKDLKNMKKRHKHEKKYEEAAQA